MQLVCLLTAKSCLRMVSLKKRGHACSTVIPRRLFTADTGNCKVPSVSLPYLLRQYLVVNRCMRIRNTDRVISYCRKGNTKG